MADATRRVSVRLSLDDAARVKAGLREVGETGQRSLDKIKGGAERASRSLDLLDVAVRGLQIASLTAAARAFVRAGDSLTQSLFRLQTATGSVHAAADVYQRLYQVSLQTGVAVAESADAFQRFSGAARAIAQGLVERLGGGQAILAVVLACAILTYGGVSLFVVAFAIYPIAASLFREADIPKRLIPATIALGAFTFTMTALPGTPAIQNAIPMPFFGTTPFAAPGLGILAALVMFGAGQWWLMRRAASARARGEGYGDHPDHAPTASPDMRERAAGEGFDVAEIGPAHTGAPPFLLAVLPVVVVILANLVFSSFVIPAWDTSFLAEPGFGEVGLSAVLGVWSIILALSLAILVLVATNWGRLASVKTSLDAGANASVLPIFNTASLVGFGAVIAALPAFELVRQGVLSLGGDNPLISLALAVNVLAGITGSASGGMSIALSTLGDTYVELGRAAGIAPEALHRITAIATGGLDSLPHNGAVVTLLAICGLSHRQSYGDLAMVAVVFPLLALVVAIAAATFLGAF